MKASEGGRWGHDISLGSVRVLDLSRVLAGPYAAQILAQLGADVIKVEGPEGDPSRRHGPFMGGRSLYFSSVNSGKRSVSLDLRTERGKEDLDRLMAGADVVIHNFRPRSARRFGLDPEAVFDRHRRLVLASVCGYNSNSPERDDPAYDLMMQASSGLMALTGETGGPPMKAGVPIVDLTAGIWTALGIVSALLRRGRDEGGAYIEVPMFDSALALLGYMGAGAATLAVEPERVGAGHHSAFPYGAYRVRDGWITVAVLEDKFWRPFCNALGLKRLAMREDLRTNEKRVELRDSLEPEIVAVLAEMHAKEALDLLREAGVAAAPVNTVLDAMSSDYARRQHLVHVAGTGRSRYRHIPGPVSHNKLRPAPKLGQHNEDLGVYRDR